MLRGILSAEDLSWNGWRTVEIDLNGTFNCCQAALPHQRIDDGGCIISISTTQADWLAGAAHAAAAKSGIQNLMKTAAEWGKYNIRSNWFAGADSRNRGRGPTLFSKDLPIDSKCTRPWVGEDIAGRGVFSSDTGRYVSGAGLVVDGVSGTVEIVLNCFHYFPKHNRFGRSIVQPCHFCKRQNLVITSPMFSTDNCNPCRL